MRSSQRLLIFYCASWSAKRGDRYGLDCPSVLPSVCYIMDSIISTKTVLRSCGFHHTLTVVLANQRVVQKFDRGSTRETTERWEKIANLQLYLAKRYRLAGARVIIEREYEVICDLLNLLNLLCNVSLTRGASATAEPLVTFNIFSRVSVHS